MEQIIKNYVDHIEQLKSEMPKEVKFSVNIPEEINQDLLNLSKKLGLNRASLSRDLLSMAVEVLKKELIK